MDQSSFGLSVLLEKGLDKARVVSLIFNCPNHNLCMPHLTLIHGSKMRI